MIDSQETYKDFHEIRKMYYPKITNQSNANSVKLIVPDDEIEYYKRAYPNSIVLSESEHSKKRV